MNNFTWKNIQDQSGLFLSEGLFKLKSQICYHLPDISQECLGNYLISLNKLPLYIGEANNLSRRIKQQSKPAISTFYKNYERTFASGQFEKKVSIEKFQVQVIQTNIGRKEIEEFGIVNLPTVLNHFQLNKREKVKTETQNKLWDDIQDGYTELLKQGEIEVFQSTSKPWFETEVDSCAGLYLVKDKLNRLIYVGESSNLNERIKTHSGRTYFSALRRHIGTEILGFELQKKGGKKRFFHPDEDKKITIFLKSCKLMIAPVRFGRFELEEFLIKKYTPLLNIKG